MTIRIGLCGLAAMVGAAALVFWERGGGLSGQYDEIGGTGRLEFRGSRVYIAAPLGVTLVAPYEVDADRVIIRGGGGPQVYLRRGDTLDAGMGMKFVRKPPAPARAGTQD